MYQLSEANNVVRLSDMASIPPEPVNSDYAAYLAWLAEGNIPDPYVPPPPPPVTVISRRQAYRALNQVGLLSQVDIAIEAQTEPERTIAKIEWQTATEFNRDWPVLVGLAAALGLTESQVDDLFTLAATL